MLIYSYIVFEALVAVLMQFIIIIHFCFFLGISTNNIARIFGDSPTIDQYRPGNSSAGLYNTIRFTTRSFRGYVLTVGLHAQYSTVLTVLVLA